MTAPTETYVDPSIAADSGAGTIGDPYGDLQYALNTITRNATNGDRINILAGTDEIMGAALSFATYGTPTEVAPCILQGYTSAAGDGGIGGITGNGSVAVINSGALDFVHLIDLHCHNSGSATVITLDNNCVFINVEIDNTTGGGLSTGVSAILDGCHIHNVGGVGANVEGNSFVRNCTFEDEANVMTSAISLDPGAGYYIVNNVIDKGATGNGIVFPTFADGVIEGNSIFAAASTGIGIDLNCSDNQPIILINNIVEGFSGSGGIGYEVTSTTRLYLYGRNAAYNNATNYSVSGDVLVALGDNETLGASAFTDGAGQDFTVDTSVQAEGHPLDNYPGLTVRSYVDKGALQRQEPAGGSNTGSTGGARLGHTKI